MILPIDRDPRFITLRRGGTLTDSNHHLLALWATACAEQILPLFESVQPSDTRPRHAIEQARAWVRGQISMSQARTAVSHVAAHELGASAYAIKAARAAAPEGQGQHIGRLECRWQRDQLPEAVRELVLDDQRLRNDLCWSVFDC
jgi:hypothetical protein